MIKPYINAPTFTVKYLFFWICISLFLVSCDKEATDPKIAKQVTIPILDDSNVKEFTLNFAHDYYSQLEDLVNTLNTYQQSGDSFGFVRYRNNVWTPKYIAKKDFYHNVLEQNQVYVSKTTIKPLFDRFENLIYIGINLKNAFLDDNKVLMTETLTEISHDKEIVGSVLKSSEFQK
jgi:hypothetical protein